MLLDDRSIDSLIQGLQQVPNESRSFVEGFCNAELQALAALLPQAVKGADEMLELRKELRGKELRGSHLQLISGNAKFVLHGPAIRPSFSVVSHG